MYEKAHDVIDSFISSEAVIFEVENWYYGHANIKAYEPFDDKFLRSIGLAKDVDGFLANTVFIENMANLEKVATLWERGQSRHVRPSGQRFGEGRRSAGRLPFRCLG